MKKAVASPNSEQKRRNNKQRISCLGDFGFVGIQVVKGKKHVRKVEGGEHIEHCHVLDVDSHLRASKAEETTKEYALWHKHIAKNYEKRN